MRIIRAIFMGVIIGAAFFFVPFIIPVLFFIFFISFIGRFFFYRRGWRPYGGYEFPYYHSYHQWYDEEDIVPIDRKGYIAPMRRDGPEQRYPVH